MSRPQLTVIGLDAATFDVIDPMIQAGELPHLARLFEAGTRGVLRSTTHPLTTQAWTTMLTGVNAGRHGMWDFTERDSTGYRLRLVNGSYRQAPTVWDRLTAAGRRVGIVNVPFTWPAQEVNGFLVAGIDAAAREAGMTHPPGLLQEIRDHVGDLELDHSLPLGSDGYIDLERMTRAVETRADFSTWLAEKYEPELLLVVFMAADHMQHYGWLEWEAEGVGSRVAAVYRSLDAAVGRLTNGLDLEQDVMVVSDHGAGRMKGVVNINAWLAQHGWLAYADGSGVSGAGEYSRRALYRLLEQRRKLPKSIRNFAKQHAPNLRERVYQMREFTAIDWAQTRAFAYGNMGNVAINVRGREQQGLIEPGAEYDDLCAEIAARALELRDPETDEQLVAAVHRRDSLFDGPAIGKVPDLIFEFNEYAWAGKGNLMRKTPTIWDEIKMPNSGREAYVGTHRHEGIVALAGPSIPAGETLSGANIQDIAPTILYLLGEPVPLDLEGRVLEEAIRREQLDERPPDYVDPEHLETPVAQGYAAGDLPEVEDRLRDLGYLE